MQKMKKINISVGFYECTKWYKLYTVNSLLFARPLFSLIFANFTICEEIHMK